VTSIKKNLEKIREEMKKRNLDWVWVNAGMEGSGKSSFSIQLAKHFDDNFTADQICFTPEEYMQKATELPPYSAIILDEGIEGLFSRNAMKKGNKKLVQFFRQARELNLMHIINIPDLAELETTIRESRAKTISRCRQRAYKADVYGRTDLDKIKVNRRNQVSWGEPSMVQGWKDPAEASPEIWNNYKEKNHEHIEGIADFDTEEDEEDNLVSTGTVAERLDVSKKTVRNYCEKGKLEFKKLPNGDRRIPESEINQLIES